MSFVWSKLRLIADANIADVVSLPGHREVLRRNLTFAGGKSAVPFSMKIDRGEEARGAQMLAT